MPKRKAVVTKRSPTRCTCPTYTTHVFGKDYTFGSEPRKPISEVTAADIPPGIDIEDIGCACGFWTMEKYAYATKFGKRGLREVLGQREPFGAQY